MSRSVETIGKNIVYFHIEDGYQSEDWEDLILNLQLELGLTYPSLYDVKEQAEYTHRESLIILKNRHVYISISEYCGCCAVSVFTRPELLDYPPYNNDLAKSWLEKNWQKMEKIISETVPNPMVRQGTFSDGSSVYQLKNSDEKVGEKY
jgi:hypothetical protein